MASNTKSNFEEGAAFVFNDVSEKKDTLQLPGNSKAVELQLIDSLGQVNLSVPLRYDTSFSWMHY